MGRLERGDNCACSHNNRAYPAVFFDRDGEIDDERGYVCQADAFVL